MTTIATGIHHLKGFLSHEQQQHLLLELREVVTQSPLFTPTMRGGTPFKYRMTNCGQLGWVADNGRYFYTQSHPQTGQLWAKLPESLKALAYRLANRFGEPDYQPQSCLVNVYQGTNQTLGLHQDNTEKRLDRMIISVSLGAAGIFCLGGERRHHPLQEILLHSGDILIMSGQDRHRFHSFKGITAPAPAGLLNGDPMTRINLTLRQVY